MADSPRRVSSVLRKHCSLGLPWEYESVRTARLPPAQAL